MSIYSWYFPQGLKFYYSVKSKTRKNYCALWNNFYYPILFSWWKWNRGHSTVSVDLNMNSQQMPMKLYKQHSRYCVSTIESDTQSFCLYEAYSWKKLVSMEYYNKKQVLKFIKSLRKWFNPNKPRVPVF